MDALFTDWKTKSTTILKALEEGNNPKEVIYNLSESLLTQYLNKDLIDNYDMYQHLMNYWNDVMQDDCYIISADGWKADTYRILKPNSKKKLVDKGWTCDLVPKELVINRYFKAEKKAINNLHTEKETIASALTQLEEEHSDEDGFFGDMDKVNKANVTTRIKELKGEIDIEDELKILKQYLALLTKQTATNRKIKDAENELDALLYAKYPTLTETEVKMLVVDDKWIQTIETTIKEEIDHISQRLTNRIKELAECYENPLPFIENKVKVLENKVNVHLQKMGFVWN